MWNSKRTCTILGALFFSLLAPGAFAQKQGLPPRADLSEYAAHAQENSAGVGAEVMDTEQVRRAFATPIYKDYVVVEVAVYPAPGQSLDLANIDFTIRLKGHSSPVRPSSSQSVAEIYHRKNRRSPNASDIALYPSVGIGYGTGGYDPVYGGQQQRGWETNGGVAVGTPGGIGRGTPRAPDHDWDLDDRSLPEGPASKAIAGYLYFPLPAKRTPADAMALDYSSGETKVHLNFPAKGKLK